MSSIASRVTVQDSELKYREVAGATLPKLENILVCSDFSKASETAVGEAIDLCRRTGASLRVLHVDEYGEQSQQNEAPCTVERRQLQQKNMQMVVEGARKQGVEAEGLTVPGHPPVTIVEVIASHRPDLAIVGTNGIHGLERMIFGSTAEAVFRHATCPVMIVGPKVSSKRQSGRGPVIFATDFHDPAKEAARYAYTLAQAKGVPLHCIHVLPVTAENERQKAVLTSIMNEALRRLTKDMESDSSRISHEVVFDSEISHAVIHYADRHNAECLVLGVGRGMLLSSHLPPHLTYRMIATAACPVLTVSRDVVRAASDACMTVYDS
jgi:nucleotide-binding universal stress UspA family protein